MRLSAPSDTRTYFLQYRVRRTFDLARRTENRCPFFDVTGEQVLYRLLDTAHAHALEKLRDSGEFGQIQQRRAQMEK
jgi:hypothetical protein